MENVPLDEKRRMLMKKSPWWFLVSFTLLIPTFCLGADFHELKDLPLEWKPTNAVSSYGAIDMTVYKKVRLMVTPFGDTRKKPAEIGRNIEKKFAGRNMLVTTKDSVPDWLTFRFARIFSDFDLAVVKGDGNLKLEAEVIKFYVTEESTYKAEVSLKVRLKSADNKKIWEGMATGTASRFGSSFRADNYFESLSDATISAVHNLLKNNSFVQAVYKTL
jgi:hypothetical protein